MLVLLLARAAAATSPPPPSPSPPPFSPSPPPLCAEDGAPGALRLGTLPVAARDGAEDCTDYDFSSAALDQNDCIRFGAENSLLVYAVAEAVAAYAPAGCTRYEPWTAQDRLYFNNPSNAETVDHARYSGRLHLLCSCDASPPPAASPSSPVGSLVIATVASVSALCLICSCCACGCLYCRRGTGRDAQPPLAPPPPQGVRLRTLWELADFAQDAL